jgi:hypothetical protein
MPVAYLCAALVVVYISARAMAWYVCAPVVSIKSMPSCVFGTGHRRIWLSLLTFIQAAKVFNDGKKVFDLPGFMGIAHLR